MTDTEQKITVGEVSDLPPPPAYQPEGPPASVDTGAAPPPPKYAAKPVPLPTYAQSEQYEKEGVLPPSGSTTSDSEDNGEAPLRVRRWDKQNGTCFEFTLYFIVCALFSIVGFVIAFCMASSTAAQSGAIAGLGTALISKPLLYEMYYSGNEQQWSRDWCSQHTECDLNTCIHWTTNTMRGLFFIIGFFGLVMLYKGFASFFASRGHN